MNNRDAEANRGPAAMTDPDLITLVSPPDMYRPASYEHAAIVGDLVFTAGQVARDRHGALVAPGDIAAQATQAYANLARVLEVAGCGPVDVVKLTTFLVDGADASAALAARAAFFGTHRPPHTILVVAALAHRDMRIEVEVIARRRARC
jgi:2-iminobutanoate/2-iminopropanoate deaminase